MKLLFITSYLSIHTIQLFKNIINNGDVDFVCVECEKETEERKKMHYKAQMSNIKCISFDDFKKAEESKKKYDVVIVSDFSNLHFISKVNADYFLFMSEHFKKSKSVKSLLATFKIFFTIFLLFKKSKSYVLCNSSLAGKEYRKALFKKNHILKFGYFPLINNSLEKSQKKQTMLWSGRLLNWKRPETSIFAIDELHKYDNNYSLSIVGNGPQEETIKNIIKENNVQNVFMYNFLERDSLIKLMAESELYLFSSDIGEGWGVVLNEALANGCVVFANRKAGSTNFLVKDGCNGFTYSSLDDLKTKIKYYYYLSDSEKKNISINATKTINELWNDKIASERLYLLITELIKYKTQKTIYKEGPVSYYFGTSKK